MSVAKSIVIYLLTVFMYALCRTSRSSMKLTETQKVASGHDFAMGDGQIQSKSPRILRYNTTNKIILSYFNPYIGKAF